MKHVIKAGVLRAGEDHLTADAGVTFRDEDGREFTIVMSPDDAAKLAAHLYRNVTLTIETTEAVTP